MALNFPNPNQSPYTDPVSGLKYVFNTSVNAWEAAIQPPVIVSDADGNPPDITIEGFLYLDVSTSTLYCYRNGSWVPVSAPGGNTDDLRVSVQAIAPSVDSALQGDLWWDTVSGQLFIFYVDSDSRQWVAASPTLGAGANANVITGPNEPGGPVEGDLWFDTDNDVLYIYHNNVWTPTKATTSGVDIVNGTYPIIATVDGTVVTVSIAQATISDGGQARFANESETQNATQVNAALAPGRLANALKQGHVLSYLPEATDDDAGYGVIRLATDSEVAAGLNRTKAVTPYTLDRAIGSFGNPVGTIIAFAGPVAPNGYLICDGTKIDPGEQTIQQGSVTVTADFTELHDLISTYYSPNDVDHVLPDLRGEFLRGWSNGRPNVDPGRKFGEFKLDTAQRMTATVQDGSDRVLFGCSEQTVNDNPAAETVPRSVAILYCIKY